MLVDSIPSHVYGGENAEHGKQNTQYINETAGKVAVPRIAHLPDNRILFYQGLTGKLFSAAIEIH